MPTPKTPPMPPESLTALYCDKTAEHLADGQRMKQAWAVALYLVLAALWLPGFDWGTEVVRIAVDAPAPTVVRKFLRPPVEVPVRVAQTRNPTARRVPMPDLTPEEPEPYIAPTPPEVPTVVPTDTWEIGIPDAPPPPEPVDVPRVGQIGVEPPVFTHKEQPAYPDLGRRLKLRGYVILEAVLRKDGTVADIQVLRGIGEGRFGFEDAAAQALRKWTFLPGRVNGKPADVRMTLKVDFHFAGDAGT